MLSIAHLASIGRVYGVAMRMAFTQHLHVESWRLQIHFVSIRCSNCEGSDQFDWMYEPESLASDGYYWAY